MEIRIFELDASASEQRLEALVERCSPLVIARKELLFGALRGAELLG